MSNFVVYQVSLELIDALRDPVATIRTHDRNLADQLQRASTSVVLNIAEGRRRVGRDRRQHFLVSLGSAGEVGAALDVALGWRYMSQESLAREIGLADRVRALLWGLLHGE